MDLAFIFVCVRETERGRGGERGGGRESIYVPPPVKRRRAEKTLAILFLSALSLFTRSHTQKPARTHAHLDSMRKQVHADIHMNTITYIYLYIYT